MSNDLGTAYDHAITNQRRLVISHSCLGLIAALAYWIRPGTVSVPLRWSVPHGADVAPIVVTLFAWIPYLISLLISRSLLGTLNPRAAVAFIVAAIAITAGSLVGYLNLLNLSAPPSPIWVAVAVTALLLAAAFGISAIGSVGSTK